MALYKKIIRRPVPETDGLPTEWHPILRRVYAARGIRSASDLDYGLARLPSWESLKGIGPATALLVAAIRAGRRIVVVGDFDADGATSTALAVLGLRSMGAAHVEFLVPNRFEFGYGLTPEIVQIAAKRQPDLLITVDNGIASCAGVALAKSLGISVLITDHHLAGPELPDADAIVNPNQPGCPFPGKAIAGVGVMFFVLMATRATLRAGDWFRYPKRPEPNLAQFLDLVALGTVADVVPLDYVNRIFVHQGVARIRAGFCRPGIRALAEVSARELPRLTTSDLGFALAPRLNAAGRLDDMTLGISCLTTDDLDQARLIARQLHWLNTQRREIEAAMHEQALAITDDLLGGKTELELPSGLCLFDDGWHQGVIGILASRIKEKMHRPVIAFAPGNGTEVKGSARSIHGIHIRDILDRVATEHPDILIKFGGHAMAAGLTLNRDNLQRFSDAFNSAIDAQVSCDTLRGIIYSDGELPAHAIDVELAENLRQAGPWGQTFSEPVFDGSFRVVNARQVAEKHLKLVVSADSGSAQTLTAMYFNYHYGADSPPPVGATVNLAYRLDVNEYLGRCSPQLIVEPGLSLAATS